MVFYHQLPEELWFIIYRIEHNQFLSLVNKDIRRLAKEVDKINNTLFSDKKIYFRYNIPLNANFVTFSEYGLTWNINEWLAFNNVKIQKLILQGNMVCSRRQLKWLMLK